MEVESRRLVFFKELKTRDYAKLVSNWIITKCIRRFKIACMKNSRREAAPYAEGKARLLYEVAPMGFMAEQAGGAATRGVGATDRVTEVVPQTIHQRSPMFVGSKTMVGGLQKFLADREA